MGLANEVRMAMGESRDEAMVGVDGATAATDAAPATGAAVFVALMRLFTGEEGGGTLDTGDTGGRLVSSLLVQIRQ